MSHSCFNLYIMHTCTNTPLLIVFKDMNNCAILVIYCKILIIYVCSEGTGVQFMCHGQRFDSVDVHSGEENMLVLECGSICCYVLWPLEGSTTAS